MQLTADLHDRITDIGDVDMGLLSDDELADLVLDLHTETARLTALKARVFESFETRKAYRPDGSKTAPAWLARHTRSALGTSRRQFREARRLRHMDITRSAFASGEIGDDHIRVLCALAGSPRDCIKDAFGRDEAMLVEFATTNTFDAFATAVTYWLQHVDPDGAARGAKDQYDSRRLHLSQSMDGSWHLDGYFDKIQGEIIHNGLEDIYQQLFDQDWAQAKAEHGEATTTEDLARTPAQRRADALQEMATRSRTAPADGKRPAPLFTVLLGWNDWAELCKLAASGTIVTPTALLPYLNAADIERSIWAPGNRCLELSTQGPFVGALRRVLELRDQQCTTAGCIVPASRCDGDHIVPRSKGGLTTQANGQLKCGHHNRHKSDRWPYEDDDP